MKQKRTPATPVKKSEQRAKAPTATPVPSRDDAALMLPLSVIHLDKNVREDASQDIEGLAQSIQDHGILNALTVTRREGKFWLVAGERRYRALMLLKATHAPVRFVQMDEKEAKTVQVLENIQRRDLDGVEEVRGVAQLLPFFDGNQSALARSIGRDPGYVNRCVRAAKLLSEAGYATPHRSLTKSMLFELADAKDPKKLLSQVGAGEVKSVKEAREKSGPIAGGRFGAEKAVQFRDFGDSGRWVLKVAYCPERTPQASREAIIAQLRDVLRRLEETQTPGPKLAGQQ